jgi:Ser/Thr protein kinase RdoA (MazF antagonist)
MVDRGSRRAPAAVLGAGVTGTWVHGTSGELVPARWPGLTLEELEPVLALYASLGKVRGVIWHSPRPFAASGVVSCDGSTVFVKRHDGRVRSPDDLREEHGFIFHLHRHGAAVPRVLAARYGDTAPARGGYSYEVHALLPLADPYRDAVSWSPFASPAHARDAGRALAELHIAAEGFRAPRRRTGLLVADFKIFGGADPMAALMSRAGAQPLLEAALAERNWQRDIARVLLPLHARLAPYLPALPPLWTHNDFHASNLLWTGHDAASGVAAVLDFGLSNRTTAMFDLATAIERNAVEWLLLADGKTDIAHAGLARALIEGYRQARKLPQGEARALPHVLPLVHAEFALSELAYFHGIAQSPASCDAAYDDFLLGHAAWFGTAHGQAFQQELTEALG